jgi:hypothetical protein
VGMRCQLYATEVAFARKLLADPEELHNIPGPRSGEPRSLRLEKSWHGLHFVLTGTPWAGKTPLCFLLSGGKIIGEQDEEDDDVPARVLLPDFVRRLKTALAKITPKEFERRFDISRLAAEDIYPDIWKESPEDLLGEYRAYFDSMKKFVASAADRGDALVVLLG